MSTPLFRQEALDHQREPMQGSLLLAVSPGSTVLGIAAFAIAALLISYAWMGEFSRKAHVQGYLAPNKGLIKVYPQVLGTLVDRRVEEGQVVRAGEVLAVISTERGSLSVRAANGAAIGLLNERQASLEKELVAQEHIVRLRYPLSGNDLTGGDLTAHSSTEKTPRQTRWRRNYRHKLADWTHSIEKNGR